jgi:hypothetical protein
VLHEDGERLRTYIDQLLAEVLKQSDQVSVAIMTGANISSVVLMSGLPRMQQDTPTVTLEGVEELPEEVCLGLLLPPSLPPSLPWACSYFNRLLRQCCLFLYLLCSIIRYSFTFL